MIDPDGGCKEVIRKLQKLGYCVTVELSLLMETGLSIPDTSSNQSVWPQTRAQKPGCGFPSARVCACFSLESGSLLSYEIGSKKNHPPPLLRKQWKTFKTGDIFLGDKAAVPR